MVFLAAALGDTAGEGLIDSLADICQIEALQLAGNPFVDLQGQQTRADTAQTYMGVMSLDTGRYYMLPEFDALP